EAAGARLVERAAAEEVVGLVGLVADVLEAASRETAKRDAERDDIAGIAIELEVERRLRGETAFCASVRRCGICAANRLAAQATAHGAALFMSSWLLKAGPPPGKFM